MKGALLYILLLLLFSVSYVNAAIMHPASSVVVNVDGVSRTLDSGASYFIGTHNYTSVSNLMVGQHDASQIWVSVKDGEKNLIDALKSTNKLCPKSPPTTPLGPSDKTKAYHLATDIQLASGENLQQAINENVFCGCIPGETKSCSSFNTACINYADVTCTSSGTWPACNVTLSYVAKGTVCSGGVCSGYQACDGLGNCVCVSGTLACFGSSTSSIALSYSYSNSMSNKVSIFMGNAKLITYTGSSGSGTYTMTGLSSSTIYTFYLRDGNTASSRLLAQRSCMTDKEEREEREDDYSNLPNRILDGGNGGGKVICTELYSTGVLDGETYKMDVRYASEHFSKEAIRGYQAWAIPVVKFMRKSPEETERMVIPLVNSFMEEIAYRSGKRETGNEVGKLFLDEGVPLFERIGKYIDEPDWKSLFNQNWLGRILKNGDFLLYYIFNYKYLLQEEDRYDEIVENYFTEQKVREMFYDAERRGGNSQLAIAKALVENLEDAVEDIESLIKSA